MPLLADIYSYELQDDRIFRLKDPLIQAHGVRCRNEISGQVNHLAKTFKIS